MNIIKISLLVFTFLLTFHSAYALGIAADPDSHIEFEPNFEKEFHYSIRSQNGDVEIYISGLYADYFELSREIIRADDKDKTFHVKVKLPEKLDTPGRHKISIGAREISQEKSGIGTRVDIRTNIQLNVMHDGKFIEASFAEPNVDNGIVHFAIFGNNFGTKEIESAEARIEIYDLDDNLLETIFTDSKQVKSNEGFRLDAILNASSYKVGDYRAVATVTGDGRQTKLQNVFRIGELKININDFTKELAKDEINKIDVEIESNWNERIEDVFVELRIKDQIIKSALYSVEAFEKKNVTLFLDTTLLEAGNHGVEFILFYLDRKTIKLGEIQIIEPEEALFSNVNSRSILLFGLVGIVVILIILNIILLRKSRKKED